jgi:hypothetical protein
LLKFAFIVWPLSVGRFSDVAILPRVSQRNQLKFSIVVRQAIVGTSRAIARFMPGSLLILEYSNMLADAPMVLRKVFS